MGPTPMEDQPVRFSVVITVYEREELLLRSLIAVATQTIATWDLQVITDGPHPVAETMVDEFRALMPEVANRIAYRTIERDPNAFGNRARRLGIERAEGDYTAFIGHEADYVSYAACRWLTSVVYRPGIVAAHF